MFDQAIFGMWYTKKGQYYAEVRDTKTLTDLWHRLFALFCKSFYSTSAMEALDKKGTCLFVKNME